MNKKCLIFPAMILTFSLSACTIRVTIKEKETQEIITETLSSDTFSETIPDPEDYFTDSSKFERLTSENGYFVYLDNAKSDQFKSYIKDCKSGIWTDEIVWTEYSWYSNSGDGKLKIMLDIYGNNHEYMTIVVKENKEEMK